MNSRRYSAAILISACAASALPLYADTFIKADNLLPLSDPASWVNGAVPGSLDLARWDNTVTSPQTLDLADNTLWGGIQLTNPGGSIAIGNPAWTLTLGSLGIDMASATQELTLAAKLALASSQTWNIATHVITLTDIFGPGATLNKAGAGTLTLTTSNLVGEIALHEGVLEVRNSLLNAGSKLTLSGGTLDLNSPSLLLNSSLHVTSAASVVQHASATVAGALTGNGTILWNMNLHQLSFAATSSSFTGRLQFEGDAGTLFFGRSDLRNATVDFGNGPLVAEFGSPFPNNSAFLRIGAIAGGPNVVLAGAANVLPSFFGTSLIYQIGELNTHSTFHGAFSDGRAASQMWGSSGTTLQKSGTGTLTLTGTAHTYTGALFIEAGTVAIHDISAIGGSVPTRASSAPPGIVFGASFGGPPTAPVSLRYSGTGGSTNRSITIQNANVLIDSSGTGPLRFLNPATIGATAFGPITRTLTLTGSNTDFNTFLPVFSISGNIALAKNGPGTWVITIGHFHTGGTFVNAGTLYVRSIPAATLLGDGPVVVASGATLGLEGNLVTALNVNTGARLSPGFPTSNHGISNPAFSRLVTLANLSVLDLDLLPGSINDALTFTTGSLSLGAFVNVNAFKAGSQRPFLYNGDYPLITFAGPGNFTGNVANLHVANADTTSSATYSFSLVNSGTSGASQIVLHVSGGIDVPGWTGNGSANFWDDAANWSAPAPGSTPGDVALFGTASTTSQLFVIGDRRLDTLLFQRATSYTLDTFSGGRIIMDAGTHNAHIAVVAGAHTVTAPVQLDSDTTISLSNATLTLGGSMTAASPRKLSVNGPGVLIIGANMNFPGTVAVEAGGTLRLGTGSSFGSLGTTPITLGGVLNIVRSDLLTIANPISGSGTITATSGTAKFATPLPDFTGMVRSNGGTIALVHPLALQKASLFLPSGSLIFSDNITQATVGDLIGSLTISLTNNANQPVTLTIANDSIDLPSLTGPQVPHMYNTYTGVIIGAPGAALAKTGRGYFYLTNANSTFSGGVTLAGGVLGVGANSSGLDGAPTSGPLGRGPLIFAGGTLASGTLTATNISRTLGNNIIVLDGTASGIDTGPVPNDSSQLTLGGNILAGSGTLTRSVGAGSLNFGGINGPHALYGTPLPQNGSAPGFTGTFINDYLASAVRFTNQFSGSPAARWIFRGGGPLSPTVTFAVFTGTVMLGEIQSTQRLQGSGTTVLRIGDLNTDSNISGQVATLSILKVGSGSLTLSSNNSYSNPITQFTGPAAPLNGFSTVILEGTIIASHNMALGTGALALGDVAGTKNASLLAAVPGPNPSIAIGNPITTIAGSSGLLTLGSAVDMLTTYTSNITLNHDLVVTHPASRFGWPLLLSGSITGSAGIIASGPGTIMISGPTSYAGATTILAGQLTLANSNQSVLGISGPGTLLTDSNATLTSDGVTVAHWKIDGTHLIRAGGAAAGTSKTQRLDIKQAPDNSFLGKLDLREHALILQSTDPADKQQKITQLTAALTAGSNGATWTGNGITSSTAAANNTHYAEGLFDNALLGYTTFAGQIVDNQSLLVSIARYGDNNLDGIVDINDLGNLANNWQQPQTTWSRGDFNMDGFVDINDLGILASNWQQSSAFPLSALVPQSLSASSPSPIPEPSSLALLAATFPLLLRRRRKSQ